MKALTISYTSQQQKIELIEKDRPEPQAGECLVQIATAALNRRDYWIAIGKYPDIRDGVILGSDGCGLVVKGEPEWMDKKVIINPNINWGEDPLVQSPEYKILGNPVDGTLAQYISVPADRLIEKPLYLSDEEAAAFPLAGLTAYRAVFTKAQVREGQKVLVTGAGGGVAQFACSFCQAAGADVYVTSSSDKKISEMKRRGAAGGYNYTEPGWTKGVKSPFDIIIDSAGGNALNDYLKIIKPAGKIVLYGSTTGRGDGLDTHRLFWSQASIQGSTMGNDEEFRKMVDLVTKYEIAPIIHQVVDLKNGAEAVKSLGAQEHFGKTIIKMPLPH